MKHWKVYETNPAGFRFANIANAETGKLIFQSLHDGLDPDAALADAKLVAAAPDLLAALKELYAAPTWAGLERAHAAIVKAGG